MAMPRADNHFSLMGDSASEIRNQPPREALLVRKAKHAEEAISAMAEYEQHQRATLEKTAKLRAERLAQQPGPVEKKPTRKANPKKQVKNAGK
jgi:hypothetical protein